MCIWPNATGPKFCKQSEVLMVALAPRNFAVLVLKELSNDDPDLVTDSMIESFNRWVAAGNRKEYYAVKDVTKVVDWFYSGK